MHEPAIDADSVHSPLVPIEDSIEAVLAQVPAWAGRIRRFAPVGGGISNANWRVWIEGETGSYFVKIPGRGTEMFIDRRAAFEASRRAHAIGIGPRVIDIEAAPGVEIVEFVEGRRTASNRDFFAPAARGAVIDTYRKLHASGPLSLTKTIFDMIEDHLVQIASLKAELPPRIETVMAAYREARTAIEASGLDLVPCFNDPMPGNFLFDEDDTLVLIDYEYASNNDRCFDLAAWSAEMFFEESVEVEIIERYFGSYQPRLHNRITVYKAMADLKWTLWSMIQNRVSALDFDFYQYGVWKLMRARAVTTGPRWPALLGDV